MLKPLKNNPGAVKDIPKDKATIKELKDELKMLQNELEVLCDTDKGENGKKSITDFTTFMEKKGMLLDEDLIYLTFNDPYFRDMSLTEQNYHAYTVCKYKGVKDFTNGLNKFLKGIFNVGNFVLGFGGPPGFAASMALDIGLYGGLALQAYNEAQQAKKDYEKAPNDRNAGRVALATNKEIEYAFNAAVVGAFAVAGWAAKGVLAKIKSAIKDGSLFKNILLKGDKLLIFGKEFPLPKGKLAFIGKLLGWMKNKAFCDSVKINVKAYTKAMGELKEKYGAKVAEKFSKFLKSGKAKNLEGCGRALALGI